MGDGRLGVELPMLQLGETEGVCVHTRPSLFSA